ncbi:MAG: transposase [Fulvivirga sp.]|nr:transposase [Fulvivirga sp.]
MIYSGIDLHKTNMVITTIDSNRAELACVKLPCRKAEVSSYFSKFERPHRAAVESTGSWYWLSDLLTTVGVELILAHALQLKAISYAKVKTDAVDAGMLAELLRVGLMPEAHRISPAMRHLREVMRTRLRLVVRRTAARVQIHSLAEKAG